MEFLAGYWSRAELLTNGILLLHLIGATAVGLALGYERSYHGRAAGMRTYALVCATAASFGLPGKLRTKERSILS